jgi:hypothetical protein
VTSDVHLPAGASTCITLSAQSNRTNECRERKIEKEKEKKEEKKKKDSTHLPESIDADGTSTTTWWCGG